MALQKLQCLVKNLLAVVRKVCSARQDCICHDSNQTSIIGIHLTWIVTTHDIIVHTIALVVIHTPWMTEIGMWACKHVGM